MEYEREERDVLRARFTTWIEIVIKNAKIDYLRKLDKQQGHLLFCDTPEGFLKSNNDEERWIRNIEPDSPYDFEEKRLSKAFLDLPVKRREIMELLFFEGLNEKETARRLNCSIQHVKNQRCIAIKKLRAVLKEDTNEKI